MKKEIEICEKKIGYTLRRSHRARRMRLTVYCNGNLTVTAPCWVAQGLIERFILEKSQWIIRKIKYFKKFSVKFYVKTKKSDFLKYKKQTLALVHNRIEHFNKIYGFRFNRVNIKNQRTRWGSCSRAGNLNFNYKIVLLPENLADYIIVHELCHLGEFNHSKKFWVLVARAIPDHTLFRQELKRGSSLK